MSASLRAMQILVRFRWLALGLVVATTVGLLVVGGPAPINNALDVWFVEDDPALVQYRTFQERFGNDEVAVIAVRNPAGVLNPADLAAVAEATRRIGEVPGIASCTSLSSARFIRATEDELLVEPLMQRVPADGVGVTALRARLNEDPTLAARLVSKDSTVTLLVARLEAMADIDARRHDVLLGVYAVIDDVLRKDGRSVHVAGIGLVYDELNVTSFKETPLFLALTFLLVAIALGVMFKRIGPVVLALGSVALALGMLLGLYATLGEELNMVTAILPTLMLIVGIADMLHVFQHRAARREEPLANSLAFILRPCLFTTLTTAAAFASLQAAKMQVIRDLGRYSSIGVVVALVVTFVVAAVGLSFDRLTPSPRRDTGPISGPIDRLLIAFGKLATTRPLHVLGVAGLVTLVGAFGISRIVVDTYSIDFFKADNHVRQDSDAIERHYGRYMPMEFTVDTGKKEGALDPQVLKGIAAWQTAMAESGLADWSLSLADVVSRLNQVLRSGKPEDRRVPDSADAIGQALLLYEGQPANDKVSLSHDDYRRTRVTFGVDMASARGWADVLARAEAEAARVLPAGVTIEAGGYLPLYVRMMEYVVEAQVSSFAVAFLLVFVLLGVLFRSLTLTAISMLPNLLPIFVTLGLMGLAGVRLDIATVTIAAVVIGIVVDDTIHFLHRFREELGDGEDYSAAAIAALRGAGPAIVGTSMILAFGFLVLALASVKSIVFFGLLTAAAMISAVLADLLVLPAILVSVKPRFGRRSRP